ncbi:conserved protein of unknown function [Modestobacter italicus]|uniref:Dentin sialophosphoprotein n=1 Tax=Modestobacter italicus (strain DSM 44449 / CECT 9708 / BC 501) TaxID=2732864 RepID=I4EQ56_MODI5|nr:IniB N-terminal domain-containing protein [Modestobacter marinus]CCH85519.1 conserved protein of unknown function [Modestobacter marinus]
MTNLASSLLDFILDLLRDPTTAAEFQADPEQALADAGLADVCPADVHAVMPMLADFAPVGVGAAGLAHAAAPAGHAAHTPSGVSDATAPAHPQVDPDGSTDPRPSAEAPAVEQLRYIQNTYTYTSTTTIDASHSVWAGEDVYQVFGEDVVLATGGSVAAGDDVDRVAVDNSTDNSVDVDGSFNTDGSYNNEDSGNTDIDVENSGNTVRGDGNAVGEGNAVDNSDNSDNSDHSVEVTDSLNGNAVAGGDAVSGDGNVVGDGNTVGNETDNSTDLDVDVTDSFNDNSDNSDNSVNDSLNDNSDNSDNSVNDSYDDESVDVDVAVTDSFDDESDNSVNDSLNDNSTDNSTDTSVTDSFDDAFSDNYSDNVVAVDDSAAADDVHVDA